jgi:hypothetical protein
MREDHDHAASKSDTDRKIEIDGYIKKSHEITASASDALSSWDAEPTDLSPTRTADTDSTSEAILESAVRKQIYNELEERLAHIEELPVEDELVAVFDIRDCDASSDDIEAVEEHEVHISIKHETIAKLYQRIYTEIADTTDKTGAPERLILGVPQYMRLQTWLTHIKNTSSESEFPVGDIHVVPGPMIHAINAHTSENMVHDYIREHFDPDANRSDTDTDSLTDTTE